jgi:lipid-A-disaccharide synthase
LNKKFDLSPDKNILLVLTGSRKQEVKLIYPAVIEGAKKIARQWNMQIVIGCAPTIDPKHFQSAGENVIIAQDNILDFMKHSSFGIIKSGTSTLQAGLLGLPMIIVYKANALTYHIGKNVVKIDHLGLANIIAEKTIVPELLQNDLTKENLLLIANAIIGDNARLENMKKDLSVLQARLGEKEASKNGAAIIHRYLNEHQEN